MKNIICFTIISCFAASTFAAPYNFETASGKDILINIDAWVGSGSHETILVVDWNFMGGPYTTESHAFGYKWDGTATTELTMLQAFDTAEIFTLVGGNFVENIIYNDGTDSHQHSESGSWNLASTIDPDLDWGDGWNTIEWDWNTAGTSEEYIADGQIEGINAIYFFGSYPDGQSCADYDLTIPTPEPATIAMLALGGLFIKRKKALNK